DFACHECKLIVEVDGETHLGREASDQQRTDYLQANGWLVLRFWNTQIYDELEPVLETVYQACQGRGEQPPSPPTPLPRVQGRGEQPPNPSPPSTGERGAAL